MDIWMLGDRIDLGVGPQLKTTASAFLCNSRCYGWCLQPVDKAWAWPSSDSLCYSFLQCVSAVWQRVFVHFCTTAVCGCPRSCNLLGLSVSSFHLLPLLILSRLRWEGMSQPPSSGLPPPPESFPRPLGAAAAAPGRVS